MATTSGYNELLLKYKPQPIRTAADYQRTLKQLDQLMEPDPPRAVGMMIDLLASLVEQYESVHHPAPKLPPSKLLAELLEARQVTAADVSRATNVPRSAISNVIAGRRGISTANAVALANYFRLPVTAFLKETSAPRPAPIDPSAIEIVQPTKAPKRKVTLVNLSGKKIALARSKAIVSSTQT